MNLKTTLEARRSALSISFSDDLLFIGSCFSENIGNRLSKNKFKAATNPFGIIYNPISIFNVLKVVVSEKKYSEKDIFLHNEIWKCFDFHSDVSALKPETLLEKINTKIKTTHQFLKETNTLFITLGSAWVYKTDDQKVVANCHKIPQKSFKKQLLDAQEIIDSFDELYNLLHELKQDINIVLTISPVRHIKDGIIENNQSKAALISATHKIISKYKQIFYFPAYEYVIDDLRDYRFYKNDLVHPNEMAIDYILEKFEQTFFNEKTKLIKKNVDKVLMSLNHKVAFVETEANKKFKANLILQVKKLEKEGFDFTKELEKLSC